MIDKKRTACFTGHRKIPDNDIGGIDAADRLRDILKENEYTDMNVQITEKAKDVTFTVFQRNILKMKS